MPRLYISLVSITCLLALAVSTARAGLLPRALSPADAVLVLDSPARAAQAMTAPGVIRCPASKSVGIWIESPTPLTVQGLTVRGCTVGLAVTGQGHTVRKVTIPQATFASILCLACARNTISFNLLGEAEYGIFLMGHENILEGNEIRAVTRDGILVTAGAQNTVLRNVIRGAGRNGINVIPAVPLAGPGATMLAVRMISWDNVIRENDVLGSGRFDLRQWPANCRLDNGHLANTWEDNTAGTRSNWCVR